MKRFNLFYINTRVGKNGRASLLPFGTPYKFSHATNGWSTKIQTIFIGFLLVTFAYTVQGIEKDHKKEVAILAGGCFWCVESDFDKVNGVSKTISGYIGGSKLNPTYSQVSSGRTGHTEAVKITFDPEIISYETLLDIYWRSIDPTVIDSQFCDHGTQYRPEIFYLTKKQQEIAERSKKELEKSKPFNQPILVNITKATQFYPAENYHQDYHRKNPIRYKFYRHGCGRDRRLQQLWGKS